jgi:hypothetical protein
MPGASDSDQWLRYGSAARVVPSLPVNSQQPYNASVSDCRVWFRAATLTCVKCAVSVTFSTVRVRRPRLRGPFRGGRRHRGSGWAQASRRVIMSAAAPSAAAA